MPKMYPHLTHSIADQFNSTYPIVSVLHSPQGIILKRESTTGYVKQPSGKRGKIKSLSPRALKRLAFTVFTSQIQFKSILTLTYSSNSPTRGITTKKHLNSILIAMKREFGAYSYLWWLEFTKKGRPHYHLLTTLPAPSKEMLEAFGRMWANVTVNLDCHEVGLWEKVYKVHSFQAIPGSTKKQAWEGIRKQNGAKWYILKYASKFEQKETPNGFSDVGRFFGASRDVKFRDWQEVDASETEVREYLDRLGLSVAKADILPKHIITPKLGQ